MGNFSILLPLFLAASLMIVSITAKPTENPLAAEEQQKSTTIVPQKNPATDKLDSEKIARNLVIPEEELLVLSPLKNQESYQYVPQVLRRNGPQQVMVPVQQNHQQQMALDSQNLVDPETYSQQVMVPVSVHVMLDRNVDDDDDDDRQEIMETAPTMTFMPLFAYRRIQAQRRRVYGARRNYGGHYGRFPTLA